MKGIKKVVNKGGVGYRVQKMIKGFRYDKTFDNEVAAQIYLSKINGLPQVTVNDIVKDYINKCPVSDYKGVLRFGRFWQEMIGVMSVYEVSHKLVDRILNDYMIESGLSKNTMDRFRSMLSMCYNEAGLQSLNPCRNMSYSHSSKTPKVYSVHQLYVGI